MTPEQELTIRKMTVIEVMRKYVPLLLAGKITKGQYEYVLNLANTADKTEPSLEQRAQELARTFGGRVI